MSRLHLPLCGTPINPSLRNTHPNITIWKHNSSFFRRHFFIRRLNTFGKQKEPQKPKTMNAQIKMIRSFGDCSLLFEGCSKVVGLCRRVAGHIRNCNHVHVVITVSTGEARLAF